MITVRFKYSLYTKSILDEVSRDRSTLNDLDKCIRVVLRRRVLTMASRGSSKPQASATSKQSRASSSTKSAQSPTASNEYKDKDIKDKKYSEEYKRVLTLGKGSFGEVFKAEKKHNANAPKVAIKRLTFRMIDWNSVDGQEKINESIRREVKQIMELPTHENIVDISDYWIEILKTVDKVYLYIEMEYCQ